MNKKLDGIAITLDGISIAVEAIHKEQQQANAKLKWIMRCGKFELLKPTPATLDLFTWSCKVRYPSREEAMAMSHCSSTAHFDKSCELHSCADKVLFHTGLRGS